MYKNIGIVGNTGGTGRIFTQEIVNSGLFNVFLINVRPMEDADKKALQQEWQKKGAQIVDMNAADFTDKLKNIDCVLSVVNGPALESVQNPLIDACKKAGVKLFIPSEFGFDLEFDPYGRSNEVFKAKLRVRQHLKEQNMAHLLILSGAFTDFILNPFFGIDLANKRVDLYGDLNKKLAFIHRQDIGRYLVYYFSHPEIVPEGARQILLASEYYSQKEYSDIIKGKVTDLNVVTHSFEETKSAVDQSDWGLNTFGLQVMLLVSAGGFEQKQAHHFIEAPHFKEAVPKPITLADHLANL